MPSPSDVIDSAIAEVDTLRKLLKRGTNRQVRSGEERSTAKAYALAWFNGHSKDLAQLAQMEAFQAADDFYRQLLSSTDRATGRASYDETLKEIRGALAKLRVAGVAARSSGSTPTADDPPSFSPLIADPEMRNILVDRWRECVACLDAGASLAATVMMGGLIEGLLLARITRESNQAPIFKAKAAPLDHQRKTLPLSAWGLKDYINVVHELGWISESAKDVGEVLRDYRNYIHPSKQLRHAKRLTIDDARMFWEVSKAVAREVVQSAAK
ncbi:MAG: hypothetical protein WD359_07200 [Dehalococcoidia bacterium]